MPIKPLLQTSSVLCFLIFVSVGTDLITEDGFMGRLSELIGFTVLGFGVFTSSLLYYLAYIVKEECVDDSKRGIVFRNLGFIKRKD